MTARSSGLRAASASVAGLGLAEERLGGLHFDRGVVELGVGRR